jgi:hypothetical protein
MYGFTHARPGKKTQLRTLLTRCRMVLLSPAPKLSITAEKTTVMSGSAIPFATAAAVPTAISAASVRSAYLNMARNGAAASGSPPPCSSPFPAAPDINNISFVSLSLPVYWLAAALIYLSSDALAVAAAVDDGEPRACGVCYIRSNKGKMCNKVYFLWCNVAVDAVIFLYPTTVLDMRAAADRCA